MKIIVDAFGGDNAPLEIIKGAAMAVEAYGYTVVLAGREQEIRRVAAEQNISLSGIEILEAPDVISMEDEPRSVLKEHKDCSMAVGLRALAAGEGDAFVSAGSTGALIMGATFLVKRIKGVSRAALAAIMPSTKGPVMLIDSGANVECRPEMLAQFGCMASIYMTEVMGNGKQAKVGLLNVGTEDTKGDTLRTETFALLRQQQDIAFVGNVEARDVPAGAADVIVADGFSGNVLLKTLEGTAQTVMGFVKDVFMTSPKTKLAALLVKPQLRGLKSKMDVSEYGGAPLLGVCKPVIKTHGNAKANSVKCAIGVAANFAKAGVIEKITASVKREEGTHE